MVDIPCDQFEYRDWQSYDENFTRFHQQLNDERFAAKTHGFKEKWPCSENEARQIFRAQYGMKAPVSQARHGVDSSRAANF